MLASNFVSPALILFKFFLVYHFYVLIVEGPAICLHNLCMSFPFSLPTLYDEGQPSCLIAAVAACRLAGDFGREPFPSNMSCPPPFFSVRGQDLHRWDNLTQASLRQVTVVQDE